MSYFYTRDDIVQLEYHNKIVIAKILTHIGKYCTGNIYDSSRPEKYKEIEFHADNIIRSLTEGVYKAVVGYGKDTRLVPCKVSRGLPDYLYLNNEWVDYSLVTGKVFAVYERPKLNLQNAGVQLEEAFPTYKTISQLEVGQIVKLSGDGLHDDIIIPYGIITIEKGVKKLTLARKSNYGIDGIGGYTFIDSSLHNIFIQPLPKGEYDVRYQKLDLPVTDPNFTTNNKGKASYITERTTGILKIIPDYKYRLISIKPHMNFSNKAVKLEEGVN